MANTRESIAKRHSIFNPSRTRVARRSFLRLTAELIGASVALYISPPSLAVSRVAWRCCSGVLLHNVQIVEMDEKFDHHDKRTRNVARRASTSRVRLAPSWRKEALISWAAAAAFLTFPSYRCLFVKDTRSKTDACNDENDCQRVIIVSR